MCFPLDFGWNMSLLDNHIAEQCLAMVQMSTHRDGSNEIRLLRQGGKVIKTICSFNQTLLVNLKVSLSRWLDYWLSEWLCVLFHDESFHILAENLLWIRVILLIFVKDYLMAFSIVFFHSPLPCPKQ